MFPRNPNGESGCNGSVAADDQRHAVIGLGARLHAIDTLTPRLHEV